MLNTITVFLAFSAAILAVVMTFLLFGRIYTVSFFVLSIAFRISSTLGFLLCPPRIATSAPSFRNSSFKFSESAKIMKAALVLSIFGFTKIFASSFSLKICKLSCCSFIFSTFIFSSGPYSNAISIAFPGWFV